jgi:23S rRNA (uracil1939-C5)-methyltransferase
MTNAHTILAENRACNPRCGVCHYKNFDYPAQLQLKQNWARKQLHAWHDVLQSIRPAPPEERMAYRAKSWMRSKVQDGALSFGMERSIKIEGRWEKELISWDTCPLHIGAIQEMIPKLRKLLFEKAPQFIADNLVGIWLGSPHLVLVARGPNTEELRKIEWSEILVAPFDYVWFHANSQVGRKIFGHHPIELLAGPSDATDIHPIRAFRQVAQTLLVEARTLALEHLLKTCPSLILDLYCGTGDLSLLLPPETGWIGIEISQDAIRYANSLRNQDHTSTHIAYAGTVEDRLRDPQVLAKIRLPYTLYLNPPRSGMSLKARERLLNLISEKPPNSIIYLSCSASSLARDLEKFDKAGYKIELLQPYDFFPQTEHFETLAVLRYSINGSLGSGAVDPLASYPILSVLNQ